MKKFLAIILSFMLMFPAVAFAAGTDSFTPVSSTVEDVNGSGTLGSLNATVSINPNGHSTVNFYIPSGLVGTVVPEVTVDGTNYFTTTASTIGTGVTTQAITSSGAYSASVAGFAGFRLRVSAYTSGSAVAIIREGIGTAIVTCSNNCGNQSTYTAPRIKLAILLGFATGIVSTSTQYPVQPVPSYTNGQITALRAAGSTTDNGTTVFTVYKNGISIGTLTFSSGASTATTTFGTPIALNAGDVLTLQCTTAGTITNVGVVAEGQQDSF